MSLAAAPRSRLFRKYAIYCVVLVTTLMLASSVSGLYFAYQTNRAALLSLQREKASAAASKIQQFMAEVGHQISWTHLPKLGSGSTLEQLRYEYFKLLRQVPAITAVVHLDERGYEVLSVSRLAPDVVGGGEDRSQEAVFLNTRSGNTYFGPVYFHKQTEPYITIAVPDRNDQGVSVAEVNLKFVWDLVSRIKIGRAGIAYVVDAEGRLISHPDLSLVLRNVNFAELPQVRSALQSADPSLDEITAARDKHGTAVLTAYEKIAALGWRVFVEQPRSEVFGPLNTLMLQTGLLLALGLALAVVGSLILALRMVTPIQALQTGAAQIGGGALDHRIEVKTGDELETLAEQFNQMAARLQESYANLERKVDERTHELELANEAKSRFFAAASHDLRQPIHALGLFIAQLRGKVASANAVSILEQAEVSVEALGDLFDAILDISKLDAGVLTPDINVFPIETVLQKMANDFASVAAEKGLRFRVVHSRLFVRSDPVLLERILLNLVANAVRYTAQGGVLLGCRRRSGGILIQVWDTGSGIPEQQQKEIFQEFHQLANPERDRDKGLGLGLAIVQRLADLLEHRIELTSTPGVGSVFGVEVPRSEAALRAPVLRLSEAVTEPFVGAFVVVVDDDALVQRAMKGLLTDWGAHVLTAATSSDVLSKLEEHERIPDVLICDYRLPGETGIEAIELLRSRLSVDIPAVLISGETGPELLRGARESGHPLLHKPVKPAKVRAVLSGLLATAVSVPSEPSWCPTGIARRN